MKIALVTDTHISPLDDSLTANWRAAERWLAATGPDLIVHLGDITANGVHDAAELLHAHAVLTGSFPHIRFLPGNHDIGDHPPGPGVAPSDPFDRARLGQYRDIFGLDFWSIEAGGWLLIGLNAPLLGSGDDGEAAQQRWLEQALASHNGPVGLFLHKPLYETDPDEHIVHERYVPRAACRRLLAAFAGHRLRFVAAGHTHQTRRFRSGQTDHVWVPSTAFVIPDALQERVGDKAIGVMMLEIDGDEHRFTHVVPAGMNANNLLDYAHVYPQLKEKKAALKGRDGDG